MKHKQARPIRSEHVSGAMVLGYAQEQRGSELQAGARAELMKTPLTKALVSLRGRMIARILFSLHPPEPFLNYVKMRSLALTHVMKSSLIPQTAGLLVDLHAGYSPMGVMLADELPRHRILEIDMPEVIHDKQQRLHNCLLQRTLGGVLALALRNDNGEFTSHQTTSRSAGCSVGGVAVRGVTRRALALRLVSMMEAGGLMFNC